MSKLNTQVTQATAGSALSTGNHDKLDLVHIKTQLDAGKAPLLRAPLARLKTDNNIRSKIDNDDDYKQLKLSVEKFGILQPIAVRLIGDDLQVVAGHRRCKIAAELKLSSVPVIVLKFNGEQDVRVAQLSENMHRQTLLPLDICEQFRKLNDASYNQKELAALFEKRRETINRCIQIAKWPADVLKICREHPEVFGMRLLLAMSALKDGTLRQAVNERISTSEPNATKPSGRSRKSIQTAFSNFCVENKLSEAVHQQLLTLLANLKLLPPEKKKEKKVTKKKVTKPKKSKAA